MQKSFFLKIILLALISLFLFPTAALADGSYQTSDGIVEYEGLVPCGEAKGVPCQLCHIFVLLNKFLEFIWFKLTPPIIALLAMITGAYFIFSEGDPKKIEKAKEFGFSLLIGVVLVYGSWFIVNIFFTVFNVKDFEDGGWSEVNCEIKPHRTYERPEIERPDIEEPDIEEPDIEEPDIEDGGLIPGEIEEDEDNPGMECSESNLEKTEAVTGIDEIKDAVGVEKGFTHVEVYENWLISKGITPDLAGKIANAGNTSTVPPVFEKDPTHCWIKMVDTANLVQKIAEEKGWTIQVTSGYRDYAFNSSDQVRGLDTSFHMRNMALDIKTPDASVETFYNAFLEYRNEGGWTGGLGYYPDDDDNFIHVDTRNYNADWTQTNN